MYTSIMLVALTGLVAPVESTEGPSWQTDYSKASQIVARANKPLAVFLGSKADKVSRDGQLSSEAKQLLADKFVCLHIDTSTDQGMALARQFEMTSGVGMVISDRTGQLQAYRHEGTLDDSSMVRYLARYSDPQYVVRTTEINSGERISSYPPNDYGTGSGPASSSCPTCSSCSGGRCRR
jgi:hypothetical protein